MQPEVVTYKDFKDYIKVQPWLRQINEPKKTVMICILKN